MKRIIDESLERVREILHTRRSALIALAERLMDVESVESEELKEIVDATSTGPSVVPGTNSRLGTLKTPHMKQSGTRAAE